MSIDQVARELVPPGCTLRTAIMEPAQRLGSTLDEVGELLEVGEHRNGARPSAGLQSRTTAKLNPIICADSNCCPLPFGGLAAVSKQPTPQSAPADRVNNLNDDPRSDLPGDQSLG